jgi:hypothetical protein
LKDPAFPFILNMIELLPIGLRENDVLPVLKGWRKDRFSVYGADRDVLSGIDRSATGLFGVMQYRVQRKAPYLTIVISERHKYPLSAAPSTTISKRVWNEPPSIPLLHETNPDDGDSLGNLTCG